MEATLKQIVAHFIPVKAVDITAETRVDKSVVSGSIVIHKMYAALAEEGFNVDNYAGIETYQQLKESLNGSLSTPSDQDDKADAPPTDGKQQIGLDIQEVKALPDALDYRESAFYQQNFTQAEISYCLLKPNPKESLAGLFAAKEALVKANSSLSSKSFNQLEITHAPNGQPLFGGHAISISHSGNMAVAIAIKGPNIPPPPAIRDSYPESQTEAKFEEAFTSLRNQTQRYKRISFLALLLSAAAILFAFAQNQGWIN